MLGLFFAIAALFVGPLLLRLVGERRGVLPFVDGLVLASIGLLVLGFFLPHAVHDGGWGAVAAFVIGVALPALLERIRGVVNERVHTATLFVGLAALALHALTDGLALTEQALSGEPALAAAVILHQLPVGLAVWWLVRQSHGKRAALAVLASISLATALGYAVGDQVALIHTQGFLWALAFVAGSLLHVLIHSHMHHASDHGHAHAAHGADGDRQHVNDHDHVLRAHDKSDRLAGALGALVGAASVVAASVIIPELSEHASALDGFGQRFFDYALASAPALLLGYLLAGLMVQFLPRASIAWLGGGSRTAQAARGIVFGLPMPVCSCGVVPLYGTLTRSGVPAAAAMAFLIATPELGIEAALLMSFPLLGVEMTLWRVGAAIVLAFLVAVIVSRFVEPTPALAASVTATSNGGSRRRRFRLALQHGFVESVDDTATWILAGLTIAALLPPDLLQPLVGSLPPGLDVVLAAVAGVPVYVCASGATPLAAALIAGGISPGAGLAFLLTGPATNVTTFGMLAHLHGRKVAAIFAATLIGLGMGLGFAANLFIGGGAPTAGAHLHSEHGSLTWAALAALSLVFLLSFVRQGPREFLAVLFSFGDGKKDQADSVDACCGHCEREAPKSSMPLIKLPF